MNNTKTVAKLELNKSKLGKMNSWERFQVYSNFCHDEFGIMRWCGLTKAEEIQLILEGGWEDRIIEKGPTSITFAVDEWWLDMIKNTKYDLNLLDKYLSY